MTTTTTWERPTREPPRTPRLDPVWRKAPGLLVRAPSLLAAVVGAAALLGLAAASGPLFLASASEATRTSELAALDHREAGLQVDIPVGPDPAALSAIDAALLADVAERVPELDEVRRAARTAPVTLSAAAGEARVRLAADDGVAAPAEGLALPRVLADDLGVGVGDSIELSRSGRRERVTIADVTALPIEGEWAEVRGDRDTVLALASSLGADVDVTWWFPLAEPERHDDIAGLAARLRRAQEVVGDRRTHVGSVVAEHAAFRTRVSSASMLPAANRQIAEAAAALHPPVRSLWVAAMLAGLVVVSGTGALRVRRRRREHTMLAARGVTPLTQSARAAVETVVPVAVGAVAGVVAGVGLIGWLGPAGHVPAATPPAALAAAGATAVAVLLVAAITAVSLRSSQRVRGAARNLAGRVPWELAPLVLAGLAYPRIRLADAAGPEIDPLVLAFPVLALLGAVGLVARLLGTALPRLRHLGSGLPAGRLLVLRRLAAAPGATLSLVAVAALAVGLLTSSATLGTSAAVTADAKAAVAVGADAAAPAPELVPQETVPGTTVVGRAEGRVAPGEVRVDILAVDTATFADAAAWHHSFATAPLDRLLEPLGAGTADALPAIVVGPLERTPLRLSGPGFTVGLSEQGRATAFPGYRGAQPLLVVDRALLEQAVDATDGRPLEAALSAEVWASGTAPEASERAIAAGAVPDAVTTAAERADTAALRASRWTLGYLQGVAAAAGLLGTLAVALVLTERQRAREVAYALARRMGLSRRAHRRSVATELGALLGVAVALGVGLGVIVAALAAPGIDPQPGVPPEPLLALPWTALGGTAVATVLITAAGAALIQHAADRTRVGEVLRAAD